jgi:TIR domain
MAVTLFVSHAPADDAFAQTLTQALIEAGVDARAETFGPDQQTPRDEHEIILRDCVVFLPVLSRAALSSPRARAEARHFYDAYHDEFGRFILPVLIEPLDLEELWPFLQEYQRIEGPPDEDWSPDALIAGVLQWVTLVIPARARTPSGNLRPISSPPHVQSYMLQTGAPTPQRGLVPQTRPLGEALIAIPSERALQTESRGRSSLTIVLLVALIVIAFGGLSVAALLLRGQAAQPAAILRPMATATASATVTAAVTATLTPAPTTKHKTAPPTATPTALPTVLATFVGADSTTQGTWHGAYGAQGYLIAPAAGNYPYSSIPGYALVNVSGAATYIWTGSASEPQALQKPGASDRIAACWYSGGAFALDLGITDGQTHQIAFYFLDWDSYGAPSGRVERVDAQDATSGATLDSRALGQPNGDSNPADRFNNGKYLIWNVRGHVRFTITNLNSNAVLSGVFFG